MEYIKLSYNEGKIPELCLEDVLHAIRQMKIPKGLHGSDPPRRLLQEKKDSFAIPLLHIFQNCLQNAVWPKRWKQEVTTLLVKKRPVKSKDDYRPIVITPFWWKTLESLVRTLIMEDIGEQLNLKQYGGLKGVSTEHYLMHLYDQISLYRQEGYASVLLSFDF